MNTKNIRQIHALFFSPTGTTERAARVLSESLGNLLKIPVNMIDFTLPAARQTDYDFTARDLLIAASPTYAGKLPNKIMPDWKARIHGGHTPAVPVVTFGNRSFDNALAEFARILSDNGFDIVAAAACVSRHAFTDHLGAGRPDWNDRQELQNFAASAAEKIKSFDGDPESELSILSKIPGDPDAPYYIPKDINHQPAKFLKAKPKTDLSKCSQCSVCVRRCPMGAIDPRNISNITGICIKCQSCIRHCTRRAKYFDDPAFLSHVAMLEQNFQEAKRNQFFI